MPTQSKDSSTNGYEYATKTVTLEVTVVPVPMDSTENASATMTVMPFVPPVMVASGEAASQTEAPEPSVPVGIPTALPSTPVGSFLGPDPDALSKVPAEDSEN